MQRIFYTTWVYVGHESEIAQAGDYKTSYIGRIPVIVSRDENSEIHVLINRCAHRGPTVCQQEYGNANFFRCEYHGWVYGNDGSLAGVSLRRGFGPGEIDDIQGGLDKAPRSATYRGLIFARLTPGAPASTSTSASRASSTSTTGQTARPPAKSCRRRRLEAHLRGQLEAPARRLERGLPPGVPAQDWPARRRARAARQPAEQPPRDCFDAGSARLRQPRRLRHLRQRLPPPASTSATATASWARRLPSAKTGYQGIHAPTYVETLRSGWRGAVRRSSASAGACSSSPTLPSPATDARDSPDRVDQTEILQYDVVLPGVTDADRPPRRDRGHQRFYGPAGYSSVDDIEMFAPHVRGLSLLRLQGLNQWALFSRGQPLETAAPTARVRPHVSTEVEQRAIYYAWAALMKGESHVVNVDPVASPTAVAAREAATTLKSGA